MLWLRCCLVWLLFGLVVCCWVLFWGLTLGGGVLVAGCEWFVGGFCCRLCVVWFCCLGCGFLWFVVWFRLCILLVFACRRFWGFGDLCLMLRCALRGLLLVVICVSLVWVVFMLA